MKRFGRLLVPMIVVGILVLSGCASGDPASPRRNPGFGFGLPTVAPTTSASTSSPTSGSTLGPGFKQAEIPVGKVIVYIYRITSPMFGADVKIPFDVKANGKVITRLSQGGYYAHVTEPGQIEFGAFDSGFMAPTSVFSVTVDAKAGQAYYLKGAHGKGTMGRAHLELVSPEVGANEIASCKVITAQ